MLYFTLIQDIQKPTPLEYTLTAVSGTMTQTIIRIIVIMTFALPRQTELSGLTQKMQVLTEVERMNTSW